MAAWNPAEYAANSASQQAWGRELIAKLGLRGNEHILDVGCGDGKVTAELAEAVPGGLVVGVDASPQMLRFAQKTFPPSAISNLKFQLMDARRLRFAKKFDLVFSNATLHWVDDHPAFLRGAAGCMRSGGRLVVSCGGRGNAQEVFAALRGVLRLQRWREFFRKLEAPYFFYAPADYEQWLPRCGFQARGVRLANKDITLDGTAAFAGWFRTTWHPYTQRVPENLREEFIAAVVNRYMARHPLDKTGRVHVRMVRLEIDAVKV